MFRLIVTWDAAPELNMGLDEALLEAGESPPTVRFYSWKPAALSLGYFQRRADVPAADRSRALVRRITGGGAIHHAGELTFSITAPLSIPLYRGTVADSYRRVHAAIASALLEFGVQAQVRGERSLESDRPGTGMCFHASTPLDLAWDGLKGVGSAQRRTRGRVLHHGSIKLGGSELEGRIATLESRRGRVAPADFAPALRAALESAVGERLVPSAPEAAERLRARELGKRYVDPEFISRR